MMKDSTVFGCECKKTKLSPGIRAEVRFMLGSNARHNTHASNQIPGSGWGNGHCPNVGFTFLC